jgi:hypothetical protein
MKPLPAVLELLTPAGVMETAPFGVARPVSRCLLTDRTCVPLNAERPTVQQHYESFAVQLMDTDRNGKISREEFMRFMEAEFDSIQTAAAGIAPTSRVASIKSGRSRPPQT